MYDDALRAFRTTVRRFIGAHVTPYHKAWERAGAVPRALYATAGEAGLLCPGLREENGGGGLPFRYGAVVAEELARAHATGVAFALHSEIVAPYIESYGTVEQQRAWLPGMADGSLVGAVAMSEPGAGSDLQGLTTRATLKDNIWVINGTKTFVSNGQLADLVIVVCCTEDAAAGLDGAGLTRAHRALEDGAGLVERDDSHLGVRRVAVNDGFTGRVEVRRVHLRLLDDGRRRDGLRCRKRGTC